MIARGAGEQSVTLQDSRRNMDQLSSTIEQISRGAQEQTRGVEEATHMVGQVSAAAGQVSANARAGADAWKGTAVSAEKGALKTHETIEGMERIKKAMDVVSKRVADLGQRSDEIGKIVATIDDIAAQTNLLALNAAIEAARAGDQGRGFAVVADEVRKLAERSSTATKEIAVLIGGIQSGVREAVGAMQQGGREVEDGYRLAADAGGALDDILERAREIGIKTGLHYPYVGNVPGHPGDNTYCPNCKKMLVKRSGYSIVENVVRNGKCKYCGAKIGGVWA